MMGFSTNSVRVFTVENYETLKDVDWIIFQDVDSCSGKYYFSEKYMYEEIEDALCDESGFDKSKYEDLLNMSKEALVVLYLKSERLREGQVEELNRIEKELASYENKYGDQILDELLNSLDDEEKGDRV